MYSEMNPSASYEEQRALQLAFELSMMGLNGTEEENGSVGNSSSSSSGMDEASRKRGSANMTECVPVPSSEHVAEIVGRQGMLFLFRIRFHVIPLPLAIPWQCVLGCRNTQT